jgi:hypothetical protein
VSGNDAPPKSDESKKPGENTGKHEDKFLFSYRTESMLRLVRALQLSIALEECVRDAIKYLDSPDYPASHPAKALLARCKTALENWDKGIG